MEMKLLLIFISIIISCQAFQPVPPAPIIRTQLPPGSFTPPPALPIAEPPPQPSSLPTQSQSQWGVVKCHEDQKNLFNEGLKKFLSSTKSKAKMNWFVNCAGNIDLKGGAWIKGFVQFTDGTFDPQSTSQKLVDISSNSYLEFHVISSDNRPILAIKLNSIPYESQVDGQFLVLSFQDNAGSVHLEGTLENNIFNGEFQYKNFTKYDGTTNNLDSGTIGRFSIPVCSLITCKSQKLDQNNFD